MTPHDDDEYQRWEAGCWTHLPFFILRSLTDRTLGDVDKEIAEAHLELCETCRTEADQLFALRRELLEAPPVVAPSPPRRPHLWELGLAGLGIVVLSGFLGSLLVGPRLEEQRLAARAQGRERAVLVAETSRLQGERERLEREKAAYSAKIAQLTRTLAQKAPSPSPLPSPVLKATPDPELLRLRDQVAQLEARLKESAAVVLPAPKVAVASPPPERQIPQVALALPDLSVLGASGPRGTGDEVPRFALSAPASRVVREVRPRLTWSACPGAVRYRWFVARLGALDSVSEGESDGLAGIPEKDLPRGEPLTWEVHALDAGGGELGPPAQARFQLVTERQLKRIEGAKNPLVRARALAEAGLFVEVRASLASAPDSAEKRWILKALDRVRAGP